MYRESSSLKFATSSGRSHISCSSVALSGRGCGTIWGSFCRRPSSHLLPNGWLMTIWPPGTKLPLNLSLTTDKNQIHLHKSGFCLTGNVITCSLRHFCHGMTQKLLAACCWEVRY